MPILKDFSKIKERFSVIRTSLRFRVALGVAFPVMLMMTGLSLFHYWRELEILEEQIRLSAIQLGDLLNNSISHAMVIKDEDHLLTSFSDVTQMENVQRVEIIGISGKILASSEEKPITIPIRLNDPECWNCHQYTPGERPRAVELQTQPNVLRVSTPISSTSQCLDCHQESDHHLGVLLIDMSLEDVRAHLLEDLRLDLTITILATLLITIGMFHLLNRLVVRRIESFREPLNAYASGDYSLRLERCGRIEDEICQLAQTFNDMADEIERYTQEMDTRSKVRHRAVIEERERIARELHDGVAQVLGYVTTKSNAVRLMLQKGRLEEADHHLRQLEIAAQDQFVDIRGAILGLRVASQVGSDLARSLFDYVEQFNQLSEVSAKLAMPGTSIDDLSPETVLHMLRVVQEALTNARKHSLATSIQVAVSRENGSIKLDIHDNGVGFSLSEISEMNTENFGLKTMRERADEIGAKLHIHSEIGHGTLVSLVLETGMERSA